MHFNQQSIDNFRALILDYYKSCGRSFAWRYTNSSYNVVVSEIMLQQTQTNRVDDKYQQFIAQFPDFIQLANASLKDILCAWQGLGYSRRALALQKIAQKVVGQYNAILPDDPHILVEFPGIGKATAGSICAFAFNRPTVFIETNIRTVFIHFFFTHKTEVHDNEILPLIEQTLDTSDPRTWYYALMDYGVMLKKKFPNPSRKSKHHNRQSKFEGSDRQIRGAVIKILTAANSPMSVLQLAEKLPINVTSKKLEKIITSLIADQLVVQAKNGLVIA